MITLFKNKPDYYELVYGFRGLFSTTNYLVKVIDSCETTAQVKNAHKWALSILDNFAEKCSTLNWKDSLKYIKCLDECSDEITFAATVKSPFSILN